MNLLIIQARMGSSRLPGKVLKTLAGKTILQHLVDRMKRSSLVDQLVVATTTNPEDDAIAFYCESNNINCYRGSEWDVLDRYYQAALPYSPDTIIRVTSDCPLNSFRVVDFVIEEFIKSSKDYFSNSNNEPDYLEDGFDVEVFRFNALETAWKEAKLLSEREHVTPFIKYSGKFSCGWKKFHPAYQHKLSVDTAQDFAAVEAIFQHLKDTQDFSIPEVMDVLQQHPEILLLNAESEINAGYKKSLKEDKHV